MPTLPAEPCVYPGDLLAGSGPDPAAGTGWRVLHVKPRQEKSLARDLLAREIGFYLPLARRDRPTRGRTTAAELPLFPGYVFLYADTDGYAAALGTGRVVRGLAVVDQTRLWDDLRRLHRVLDAGLPVAPTDRLGPGRTVEIATGPLAGCRGTVVRAAGGDRFVVEVTVLNRGAAVSCDGLALRPLPGPA
jgi:transcriptional antiterminator RfaH